jgi:hypothetical protein
MPLLILCYRIICSVNISKTLAGSFPHVFRLIPHWPENKTDAVEYTALFFRKVSYSKPDMP